MLQEFFNLSSEAATRILGDVAELVAEADDEPAAEPPPFGGAPELDPDDDDDQAPPAQKRKRDPVRKVRAATLARLARLSVQLEADLAESTPHWRG